MYFRRNPPRRSAWDDLDALVLEEVEAASRASPATPAPLDCDEDFLARASAHFAAHEEPEALLERLCRLPGLLRRQEPEAPTAAEPDRPAGDDEAGPSPTDSDQGPAT